MNIINGKLLSIDPSDIIDGTFQNDDITEIGDHVFIHLPTLTTIILNNTTHIGHFNFRFCDNLNTLHLPNVLTIGTNCINNCPNLSNINLNNVITIDRYCFCGCNILKQITLPNVKYIYKNCFIECMTLTSIVLPNQTISLVEGEFYPYLIKNQRLTKNFLIISGGFLLSYQNNNITTDDIYPYVIIKDNIIGIGYNIKSALNQITNKLN